MTCPLPQHLQQLLDDTLPADQQPAIQAHLETCPLCQKKVEQLAAGGVTWDKTARNLLERPTPAETALIDAVEKLQDTPTSAIQTQAENVAGPVDEDLSFLQPAQKPNSVGRLDKYEILSVIGKGGFGIVLKGFDEDLHRMVVIKVLLPHLAANGTARDRFLREARAAAAIMHENVVTIHAVSDKSAKIPYLVMQFISGMTLHDKIDQAGPLSAKEILRIGMQIAEGLAAANKHHGLVHRDIKPANILLENGVERVKISDFGLARVADDASVTQSGTVAGTPMYMSPEQANGEVLDHRSDLFSLGSVLYVMCTGRPPFRANTTMAVLKRVCDDTPTPVQQINADIPTWLADVIAKLHAKKPGDRFQTAKEVAELLGQQLARIQQPTGTSAAVPTIELPKAAPSQQAVPSVPAVKTATRRGWVYAGVGALALIAGVGFIFLMQPSGDRLGHLVVPKKGGDEPIVPVADKDGWVQLFNGKDLAGWDQPDGGKDWTAVDGILVGRAAEAQNRMLFSTRGDYQNFHLRAEVLAEDLGHNGICFRTDSPQLRGYVAEVIANEAGAQTGSLFFALGFANVKWLCSAAARSTPPTGWVVVEIIAKGPDISTRVNGKEAAQAVDTSRARGHVGLIVNGIKQSGARLKGGSTIRFRKIEIKELPSSGSDGVALLRKFKGYHEDVLGLAFSQDGLRALSSHNDGQVVLWDVATGSVLKRMDGKHEGGAESVAFAPDGTWAISGGRVPDRSVRIWDLASGKEKGVISGFPGPVSRLIMFRDGKRALAGACLCMVNLETRKIAKIFDAGKFDAIAIALSPNEKLALSGGSNKSVSLWNVESGTKMMTFEPGHTGQIRGLAFSPDGKRAVSASTDKTCRVWDVDTGKTLLVFAKHTTGLGDVAFMPDGRHVASTTWDNTVRIWDSLTGDEIHTIKLPAKGQAVVVAPDGRKILVGCTRISEAGAGAFNLGLWQLPALPSVPASEQWVQLFNGKDLSGWKVVNNTKDKWAVEQGVLVGRGATVDEPALLASERADYENFHFRVEAMTDAVTDDGGQCFRFLLRDGRWKGYEAQIQHEGTRIKTGSLFRYDTGTSLPIGVVDEPSIKAGEWFTQEVIAVGSQLTVLLNGKVVTSCTNRAYAKGHLALMLQHGTVRFRKVEIKELPATPPARQYLIAGPPRLLKTIDNKSPVRALAFTAEGDTLIAGGDHLTFFDRVKGDVLHQEKLPSQITCPFSLSKDRKTLALVYKDAALVLDLPIRKIPLQARRGLTFSAALSPDGKTLVYADEKKLWFHDRATGKTEEEGRHGNLMGLKYSPDGRFLIGINAKELMILDAKTRDVVAKKAIGPGFGGGVEISQDSKRLVTTGVSGGKFAFYVFSLPDHELQYTETNVAKAAFSLALSPDGNYLALGLMGGATSGTVQIWDLTQKKAVASWTVAKVLPLALAFSPDGKTLVTGSGNFIEVWDLAPEDPGWVQLFNGKDLTGWVPKLVKEENPFSVAEGALVVQGSPDAYLRTDKTYENFVLELECKSHRTFDVAKNQYGGAILLQMPLPDKMTVGLRAMIFPSGQANLGDSKGQFPPDLIDWRNFKVDWNQLKIESQRGKLAITLNGARVFERSNHEPVKGYLGIWSTGSGMRYRNIRIKELPVSKPAAEYALQFDGKTSHVAIPSLKRDDPNSPLTLEAWVRPEEIKDRSAAVVVLGGKGRVQLVQKPGDWSVVDYHSAKDFDHDPVKAGTAVHLAYVLDGKEARFYVGGVEVGRQPFVPSARDLEGVLHGWLGAHNDSSDDNAPGYFFAGIIGEVRISSVARYAKNFQPAQRFEPDPDTIALFHCDENSGDKLIDASGNKHHGNIVGAKWVIRPP